MFAQEYIARFGHGSAKLARQAQSKEKTLEKMVRLFLAFCRHCHLLLNNAEMWKEPPFA